MKLNQAYLAYSPNCLLYSHELPKILMRVLEFSMEKRKLQGEVFRETLYLPSSFSNLPVKESYRKTGERLFTWAHSDRTKWL